MRLEELWRTVERARKSGILLCLNLHVNKVRIGAGETFYSENL